MLCRKQALFNYFPEMYRESPVSLNLNFWILCLLFINGPQALYVNSDCFKCVSGINLSPANNNLLFLFYLFYTLY